MKYSPLIIFLFVVSQYIHAENSDQYLGQFEGNETFSVSCSNSAWNSSGDRPWSVNHYEVNGNSYKGTIKTGGGRYEAVGTISGNSASGTFKGKDKNGNPCEGKFTNTLDGDQFNAEASGSCPTVNCTFTGKVTATRK